MERDEYYNSLPPEERIAAMQDDYDVLELEIDADAERLTERRRHMAPGPRRGINSLRLAEARLAEKEQRANWLHSQLKHVVYSNGSNGSNPGYIVCRSCGAYTGKDAEYERASLCQKCFAQATPTQPERIAQ